MSRVEYYELEFTAKFGTTFCKKVKAGEAEFLQFGVSYKELQDGVGSYSTAILKLDCGQVYVVPAEHIKFIDCKVGGGRQ